MQDSSGWWVVARLLVAVILLVALVAMLLGAFGDSRDGDCGPGRAPISDLRVHGLSCLDGYAIVRQLQGGLARCSRDAQLMRCELRYSLAGLSPLSCQRPVAAEQWTMRCAAATGQRLSYDYRPSP